MSYTIESFGISDIGLRRSNNEDHFAILSSPPFFALADGMGGHNAGEIASKEAVETLCQKMHEHFENTHRDTCSLKDMQSYLRRNILVANHWVYKLALANKNLHGMGTTLCCMLLFQDNLVFAHVGDSRIYRYRKRLKQLTVDHSLRQELVNQGKLKQEDFRSFPKKNVITRAIGKKLEVEPDIGALSVQNGDIFLLCSDGLTDHVTHEEMTLLFKNKQCLKSLSHSLIEVAKEKGGSDNISLVVMQVFKKNQQSI